MPYSISGNIIGAKITPKISEKEAQYAMFRAAGNEPGKAAMLAGYSAGNAARTAKGLEEKTHIVKLINTIQNKLIEDESLNLKKETIKLIQNTLARAFSDITDYLDEKGKIIKNLNDIPKRARQAIKKVKLNDDGVPVEIDLCDKDKATQTLYAIIQNEERKKLERSKPGDNIIDAMKTLAEQLPN